MLMMMTSVLLVTVGQVESSSSLVAVAGCDGRSDKKELQVRKIIYILEENRLHIYYKIIVNFVCLLNDVLGHDHSSAPRSQMYVER